MLDMGLGINVGDFEVHTESEYEDLILEQDEEDIMEHEVVEISDDSEDENSVWEGGVEGEYAEVNERRW